MKQIFILLEQSYVIYSTTFSTEHLVGIPQINLSQKNFKNNKTIAVSYVLMIYPRL